MPSLDLPPKPRLETLLRDAFSAMELKRLVSQVCPKLDSELGEPGPSKADFVHVVVESLERRKEVNCRFFRIVLRERPHLRDEVLQLATVFSVDKDSILASQGTVAPSTQGYEPTDSGNVAHQLEMRARRWLKGMLLPLSVSMSCASGATYILEHEDRQRVVQSSYSQFCRDDEPQEGNTEDERRTQESIAALQAQIAALQREKHAYASKLKELERAMSRAVQGLMHTGGRLAHATAWKRYIYLQRRVAFIQSREDHVDEKIVVVTRYQSALIAGRPPSELEAEGPFEDSTEMAENDELKELMLAWAEDENEIERSASSTTKKAPRSTHPRRPLPPEELAREKNDHAKTHHAAEP